MSEEIKSIDIEQIMEEIRQEIKDKGYTSEMLSFKDVDGRDKLRGKTSGKIFDREELQEKIYLANMRMNVPWYYATEGNPLAVLAKKVIRKLIRFAIIPITETQNAYNEAAAQSLSQLLAYVEEQDQTIKKLEERILALEEKTK